VHLSCPTLQAMPDQESRMDGTGPQPATADELDAMLHALDADMPRLQLGSDDVFTLASAWAERHDAILALAPLALRDTITAQLERIGIRWGLVPGSRVTHEFPALEALPRRRVRER
jgi:hypothetical protein